MVAEENVHDSQTRPRKGFGVRIALARSALCGTASGKKTAQRSLSALLEGGAITLAMLRRRSNVAFLRTEGAKDLPARNGCGDTGVSGRHRQRQRQRRGAGG